MFLEELLLFARSRDQNRNSVAAARMNVRMELERIDRKQFIPNNTGLIITIIRKRSHRFSMSFLDQLTIGAVGCFAATFAQVGFDHPAGRMFTS